jgi:hypothetical protein
VVKKHDACVLTVPMMAKNTLLGIPRNFKTSKWSAGCKVNTIIRAIALCQNGPNAREISLQSPQNKAQVPTREPVHVCGMRSNSEIQHKRHLHCMVGCTILGHGVVYKAMLAFRLVQTIGFYGRWG